MKALNQLHQLLTQNRQALKISLKNWDVWLENGTLKSGTGKETEEGREYIRLEYRAVVRIENIQSDRAALLFALITSLMSERREQDPLQPDQDIEFETDAIAGNAVNVEIYLQVSDPINMTQVDESPVHLWGHPVAPAPHTFNIAESGTVTGGIK